jgi:hypothetical protein
MTFFSLVPKPQLGNATFRNPERRMMEEAGLPCNPVTKLGFRNEKNWGFVTRKICSNPNLQNGNCNHSLVPKPQLGNATFRNPERRMNMEEAGLPCNPVTKLGFRNGKNWGFVTRKICSNPNLQNGSCNHRNLMEVFEINRATDYDSGR